MVVMLRSLDIPARWVKGFAEGEQMQNDDGERVYQVTNNNAHSWVEAYFLVSAGCLSNRLLDLVVLEILIMMLN